MIDPQRHPQRALYRLVNRNWQWALVWAILATLAAVVLPLVLSGCGGARPVPPPSGLPGPLVPPGPDASPSEQEAYYRKEIARLSKDLAGAQSGLKVAKADAADAEAKTWRTWTRWLGLAGFALAAAAAGVLSWLVSPKIGVPVGGIIAGTAVAVVTYGEAVRWLPLAMGGCVLLAGGVWLLYHLRHLKVADLAARAIDAVEEETEPLALRAKLALGSAVDRAGLRGRLNRVRGKANP